MNCFPKSFPKHNNSRSCWCASVTCALAFGLSSLLGLLGVGCDAGDDPYVVQADAWVFPRIDSTSPAGDVYPSYPPLPDAGCVTGTPNQCASCTDKCPGPEGSTNSERVCIDSKCDIQCKEEYYDVNGEVTDGCEVIDDLPIHDAEATAIDMGQVSDCDDVKKTSGVLPSDSRQHLKAPTERPNGRPDFFKLQINDNIGCILQAEVQVSLQDLPPSASYEVWAQYTCSNGQPLTPSTKTGAGGSTVSVAPSTSCSTIGAGDDDGTLFVAVQKLSGPHSNANYQLEIQP